MKVIWANKSTICDLKFSHLSFANWLIRSFFFSQPWSSSHNPRLPSSPRLTPSSCDARFTLFQTSLPDVQYGHHGDWERRGRYSPHVGLSERSRRPSGCSAQEKCEFYQKWTCSTLLGGYYHGNFSSGSSPCNLLWRYVTRRWNLQVPDLQTSCTHLNKW